ncbi:hypothetical protein PHMEG_00016878 [Phytophthora megakarya]|uniref:ATP-dependent DNA helicase n=1 Tax=Phytophthora megakarya TaxID=4795 RepID=A0A225VXY6_9STRA|nr:hypothetical protein PHMEG_00016878 [Phytophthora megakarya]
MGLADVQSFISEQSTKPQPSDENTTSLLHNFPDLKTRVQLLRRALQSDHLGLNSQAISRQVSLDTVLDFPSLQLVSAAFQLNEKQNKIFVRAGTELLTSILNTQESNGQMIEFLGGLPGAGKSRVIGALQGLAEKWNSAEAVATAAYQGVAAQAADGQTIHKLFGWSVHNRKKWAPNKDQQERFARLKLIILDGISTCDVSILGKVDASLRKILNQPNQLFGGIHASAASCSKTASIYRI